MSTIKRSKLLTGLTGGDGELSAEDQLSYIDSGVQLAGGIVGAATAAPGQQGQATGNAIGGGLGSVAGALLGGPAGAALGGKLGGMVGGLVGGAGDKQKAIARASEATRKANMNIDLTANVNPYGQFAEGGAVTDPIEKATQDAKRFAKRRGMMNAEGVHTGGAIPAVEFNGKPVAYGQPIGQPKQYRPVAKDATDFFMNGNTGYYVDPSTGDMVETDIANVNLPQFQKKTTVAPGSIAKMEEGGAVPARVINIEQGELLSDKEGNVLTRYMNPNRYSKHAENQFHEPQGNFVEANADGIVVPKKLASRFENGDKLARKSILRQLVDNQVQDPTINQPQGTEQYGQGGYTGPGDGYIDPAYAEYMRNRLQPVTTMSDVAITPKMKPHKLNITAPDMSRTPGDLQRGIDLTGAGGVPTPEPAPGGNSGKLDLGMVGRRVGSKIPALYQMVNAMQGDPHLRKEYNNGFSSAKSNIMQMDEGYNVDPELMAIDRSTALGMDMIGANNTPAARAEAAAIHASAVEGKGQVFNKAVNYKRNIRNNMLSQLANLDVQQGSSNQAEDLRFQTEQRMNAANDQNIMANVLNENYRMDSGWQNDMEKIKMINSMSKFEDINPLEVARFSDDPDAMQYIYSQLQSSRPMSAILQDLKESRAVTAPAATRKQSTPKKSK